jgi:hypothetical protein
VIRSVLQIGAAGRTARRGAMAALLLAGAVSAGARGANAGAPEGVIAAFERAPAVVVAEVESVTPLAHAGYQAALAVERSLLRGATPPPQTLLVAWEEPVQALPPRLVAGRRILAAAEPLPTASIWRTRVPDPAARAALTALASDGAGYLERPGGAELHVLEHYLQLDSGARMGEAGALYLARLCAVGQPSLANDAAARLAGFTDLADHLSPPAAAALVDALLRPDLPELRATLLARIESARPEALRLPLQARIRAGGNGAPPILFAALGALDGGLEESQAMPLLAHPSADAREAAAQYARGPKALAKLRTLVSDDADPTVRATAVTRLVSLEGAAALADATRALGDPAPQVRLAAVRAAASLDPEAVEPLRDVALGNRPDAARAALAALALMGTEGQVALATLALEHPDESMRALARLAIGQDIGHQH